LPADPASNKQALQYAKELVQLYRREKEQREKLEIAFAEVKKLNAELEQLRVLLDQENRYLREEVNRIFPCDRIIGGSFALQEVMRLVETVGRTDVTALIEGETGTGKELIARAIHANSRRKDKPLVKVNCGAIPHELFESEFFGHVKGSFTGAVKDRVGRFQTADKGTLFLDEVGEIPLDLQSKLLRVLQEGQFEPVGEDRTRAVDVRIIAASNRNLRQDVDNGRFREDLYYRLSVLPIQVPPLRHRIEDIEPLARHFLETVCVRFNIKKIPLTGKHIEALRAYDWPGNIRELQNAVERAVLVSQGKALEFHLPKSAAKKEPEPEEIVTAGRQKENERDHLLKVLNKTNWKIYGPRGAAELLDMNPATLTYRVKKMGLKKPH
jgi:transcriptional regulator with GAF, ATPase, and Fis domain